MKHLNILFLLLFALIVSAANAQLVVTSADSIQQCTPEWLVKHVLLESGVTVSNVKFNGSAEVIDCNSIGYFETGDNPTNLGIESGLILATGGVSVAVGPNDNEAKIVRTTCDDYTDESLEQFWDSIFNVAVLEFDFVPWDSAVSFNYVFGSEEYLEWVGSLYNDVFGFFVTGPNPDGGYYDNQNMALIPGTDETVSINSVYTQHNSQYYVNNANGETIQFDGFTTVLTVSFKVVPLTEYHIKMGICDVGDPDWDSGVFLEAHSFMSNFTYDMTIDKTPYQEVPENYYFCTNHSIEFSTITEWNFDDVVWYFGDGTSAHGASVLHTYAEDGIYEVVNVLRNPHRTMDSLYLTTTVATRTLFSEETASTCDDEPYLWHGQLLEQSGIYVDTLGAQQGCDSIVTLHLTVYKRFVSELDETHCDSFEWYGQTYTESGIYEYNEQSSQGCDSLLLLNLIIRHEQYFALQGPILIAVTNDLSNAYEYYVPDLLGIAPNTLTWSCDNPDWEIQPFENSYRCHLLAHNLGQGTLMARTGVECDSVFSIEITASGYDVDENKSTEIQLFPNPAQSRVTIEGPQIDRIRIMDSFGQMVLDNVYEPINLITLGIGSLSKGIYLVEVFTAKGRTIKRLIKE